MYRTPSGYVSNSDAASSANPVPRSAEDLELEFNNSTERVLGGMGQNISNVLPSISLPNRVQELTRFERPAQTSVYRHWHEDVFDGNYQAAAQKLKKRIALPSPGWVLPGDQLCFDGSGVPIPAARRASRPE